MSAVTRHLFPRRVAPIFGFVGVALGAFGAHGFHDVLSKNGRLETWDTAVLYHLVHAAMLFLVSREDGASRIASWLFALGIVIFSGSLYVLALTNLRWLGAITPLGGLALLGGWLSLVLQKTR